jgi:hypothetical protein
LRRLLAVVAFAAALIGPIVASTVPVAATGSDYSSSSIPAADADRDVGKAAICPQTQDIEALPKRRSANGSEPPAVRPVAILDYPAAPRLGARPYPDRAAVHRTARRNVVAQPRAPPASRS